MRVRILRRPVERVDGVALDHFRVGAVYDLRSEVACLLLAEGWAEIVADDDPPVFVRPPAAGRERPRRRVLVVDDDPEARGWAGSLLAEHGYDVMLATNGRDAIQRLRECCPDVIVLDLDMPVMDGWQFRVEQRFLIEKKRATVPVVLMTGLDDAPRAAASLRAAGLVTKPVDPEHLVKTVSAAIRRSA